MNPHIPFFSELHHKAIPAVQQLFDETRADGYSLAIVYSNFVSRLSAAGVSAPARKLVKQWLAGVQLGTFARPSTPEVPAVEDAAPVVDVNYFGATPDAAVPALAEAWDAIRGAIGGDINIEADEEERAYDDFFAAVRTINLPEPSWRAFVGWAKGVRAGEIGRPGLEVVEEPAGSTVAPEPKRRGRRAKADVLVSEPVTGVAVQPDIITEIDPETHKIVDVDVVVGEVAGPDEGRNAGPAPVELPTDKALREDLYGFSKLTPLNFPKLPLPTKLMFIDPDEAKDTTAQLNAVCDRMIEEACAQLQDDMRRQAQKIVIARLRAVADEMEFGGT